MSISTSTLAIEIQRNERKRLEIALADPTGSIIDLTGFTMTCPVALAPGNGAVLVYWDVEMTEPEAGRATLVVDGTDLAALDGEQEVVSLVYNLMATDGVDTIALMRGTVFLTPGVPQ